MFDKRSLNLSLLGKAMNIPAARETPIMHHTEEDQTDFKAQKRILRYHEFIEKLSKDLVVGLEKSGNKKKGSWIDENEESFETKLKGQNRKENKSTFGSGMQRFPPVKYINASPGSYDIGKPKYSVDLNRKGYGNGFISKNERFGYLPPLNSGPGPGQYSFQVNVTPRQKPKRYYGIHPPKIPHDTKVRPLPIKDDFPGPVNSITETSFEKYTSSYKTIYAASPSPKHKKTGGKRKK